MCYGTKKPQTGYLYVGIEFLCPGDPSVSGAAQTGYHLAARWWSCSLQCIEQMLPCLWVPQGKKSWQVQEIIPEVSVEIVLLIFYESPFSFKLYLFQEVCPQTIVHCHFPVMAFSAFMSYFSLKLINLCLLICGLWVVSYNNYYQYCCSTIDWACRCQTPHEVLCYSFSQQCCGTCGHNCVCTNGKLGLRWFETIAHIVSSWVRIWTWVCGSDGARALS